MGILDMGVNIALKKVREKFMDPSLEGVGVIREIFWKNKKLFLTVELEGLEGKPISVEASNIEIAPDGSTVAVKTFKSNMPFAQTALDRFAAGKPFAVPEGGARMAVVAAKKVLGL